MAEQQLTRAKYWGRVERLPGKLRYITMSLSVLGLFLLDWSWHWWLVAVGFYTFYYGLGGVVGNHRYWCHKAFKTNRFWEAMMLFAAAVGGFGSTLGFLMFHMEHHRYPDTEKDPHSPAILGNDIWNFTFVTKNKGRLRDAMAVARGWKLWFYDYKNYMMLGWVTLLTLIDLRLVLFGWLIPVSVTYYVSIVHLVVVHKQGYRNFDTKDQSTNVWWLAPVAFGENWHNNHHKYPKRACTKVRWWEFDPAYWIIQLIRTDRAKEA